MTFKRKAYTLMELLTVIAISAILLTVIVLPLMDSYNLLRAGQSWSEAQERARILLDRIGTEISNSAGVRDNSGVGGQVAITVPTGPGSAHPTYTELLNYAKLDILKPAEGEPQLDALGNPVFIDPVTGKIDPTLRAPKGQVLLPAAPGATVVRYWIGLRDPFLGQTGGPDSPGLYNNPYDGLLMTANGQRDNLFVLYRAEVQPYVYSNGQYVVNSNYFDVDANGQIIFDDPRFFLPDGTPAKAARVRNWLSVAVVQTEVSRYDMVLPDYNKTTRQVTYDNDPLLGDNYPRLVPLVEFRPTHMTNEAAQQQRTIRLGEESDNSGNGGADVIRTRFGEWSNVTVRTYPFPSNPLTDPGQIGFNGLRSDNTTGFSEYGLNPGNFDTPSVGRELFDYTAYKTAVNLGSSPYPFTIALKSANARSNWLTGGPPPERLIFTPYQPDMANGELLHSFYISEVGNTPLNGNPRPNLPHVDVGTNTNPNNSSGAGAVWAGPAYQINDSFNLAWNTYNGTGGHGDLRANLQRFIDLRTVANEDGTYGPLFPDNFTNAGSPNVVLNGYHFSFPRAEIVPGSEQVWGPDQNPGPNYGNEVRYSRTTRTPGPDQYRINYLAQPQPADYATLGLTPGDLAGFNANTYDPTNFVSAVVEARYMPGYIELNSDPNVGLPATGVPFKISYRFDFTNPKDSYAVDYDTRQVISLLVTVRNYPQSNIPNPQIVTLKTTSTVRNFQR